MNRRNITKSLLIAGLFGALTACAGVTPTPTGEVNLLALTPVDGPLATTMRDAGFAFQTKGDPTTLDGVVVDGDYATANDIVAQRVAVQRFLAQGKLVVFLDARQGVHARGISGVLGLSSRGDHSGIAYRQPRKGRLQEFRLSLSDKDLRSAASVSARTQQYVRLLKDRAKANAPGDESFCDPKVPDGMAHVCFTSESIKNNDVTINGTKVPRTIGLQAIADGAYWEGYGDSTYLEDKDYLLSQINPSTVSVDVYYDNRPAALGGSWFYLQSQVVFSGYGVVGASTKGWNNEPALASVGANGPIISSSQCFLDSGTRDIYFNGPFFMGMGYTANLKNADGSGINPNSYGLLQVIPSNTNNATTVQEDLTNTIGYSLGKSVSLSSSYTTSTTVTNTATNWRILNRTNPDAQSLLYLSQNPVSAPLNLDKANGFVDYFYDQDLGRYFSRTNLYPQGFNPNDLNQTGTNITFSSAALWRVRADQDQAVVGPRLVVSPSVWYKFQTYTHYGWAFCEGPSGDPSSAFKVNPRDTNPAYFADIDVDLNQVVGLSLPFSFPQTTYAMGADGTLSITGSVNIGSRKDPPVISLTDQTGSSAKYAVTQPTACTTNGDCAFSLNVAWSPPAGASTTAVVQAKGLGFVNQTPLTITANGGR